MGDGEGGGSDESVKLAIALSVLRSKVLKSRNDSSPSQSHNLRWKLKAKERKQEILRLREYLREAQDAAASSNSDLFPQTASCNCYFFHNFGQFNPNPSPSNARFNDVLRRRFLRHVHFKERRRRIESSSSSQQWISLGLTEEVEIEQLRASVDFLLELCETSSPVDDSKFANLVHQAVDFILDSLKKLVPMGRNLELVEGIINSLVTRLVRQMSSQEKESQHIDTDAQFYIQHLIRKLGSEAYIGQRAMLSVSQGILMLAEHLLFSDPFDDSFPDMHECMFRMIQLIEFLVSDYLLEWSKADNFDNMLLEDWVASFIQARKAMELLENRNGLYMLYMDRITGELAKLVGRVSSHPKIKQDIFNDLFH
ncbi:hypothetical protein Lal_00040723 [Lupinus albus]|uniref:Uncharacterized protein n=1 Tax=Lupinus albus TaxID=3870 RepID=A0A6A4PJK3_LUPAL|nr:hypothetical protein Lalb_Chr13g0300771 [Lupinus albus]KAF1887669.1 hypothetical protein Lal_00040723 [Lupinus albus]